MSSKTMIQVNGLSKRYRLGGNVSQKLVGDMLLRRFRGKNAQQDEDDASILWALRDVSFEVTSGEAIGIIGGNGAGKSTLLKLLSRITEPTYGTAQMYGRVASLLEVGTGFHPELSGRENIFLNGAILGMSTREIKSKLDEIIDFSGVERFLETPVKRYSSGMRVRLGFAVAAHLEPEILIVDEVLAVGDAKFQRRCLGKMQDVTGHGRTVLFVSHNMSAVQGLCQRAVWLKNGRMVADGKPSEVIPQYLDSGSVKGGVKDFAATGEMPGNDDVRIRAIRIMPTGGGNGAIDMMTEFSIDVEFENLRDGAALDITSQVLTDEEMVVFSSSSAHHKTAPVPLPKGRYVSRCRVPHRFLNQGCYHARIHVVSDLATSVYSLPELVGFEVKDSDETRIAYFGKRPGVVHPLLDWSLDPVES